MTRTLAEIAGAAGDLLVRVDGDSSGFISGAAFDSRRVTAGDLFFCVPGDVTDGHLFAAAAAEAGAVALCVERPTGSGLPEIVVTNVRAAMPLVAAAILGCPADDLTLLGVTGTNGKTTTVFLLDSILRADGRASGLIGTIETRVGEQVLPGVRTTPESVSLQMLFKDMTDAGVTSVAMEVTSHALVLNRVDGVLFACATFTNLTQDHLDFHGDMDSYFEAKAELFTATRCERAAVNIDDLAGLRLASRSEVPLLGFGMSTEADIRASAVELTSQGSAFDVDTPHGRTHIRTSLVGPFNVSNCLAAIATALQIGVSLESIERGIADLQAVPGRFESIVRGQPFLVVVDYAHTPDSLDNVLAAARAVADDRGGRVICVFGCGGDRDRAKRPLMGIAATRGSDVVIVTSDNPRSEEPEAIIAAILEGVRSVRPEGPDETIPDRRAAIATALALAAASDVVVIAGKGHETGQESKGRTVAFDDRDVARGELEALGYAEGVKT